MSEAPQVSTCVYPWDVVGDPAAAERIAALGVNEASVAAAYHAVRAVTPRHPAHRIVTAMGSRLYFPYEGSGRLHPDVATEFGEDPFGVATEALRSAGLTVRPWVVLLHDDSLGVLAPELTVQNAFGDRYPWALCPAQPEVVEHATALVSAVSARPGISAVELEACGWYGYSHGGAHDKTGRTGASKAEEFLLSICLCNACDGEFRGAGIDPQKVRSGIRSALDSAGDFRGALGTELADAVLAVREQVATRLRRTVVSAARARLTADQKIYLHADLNPLAMGANPGLDPADPLDGVDRLMLSAAGELDAVLDRVSAAAATHDGAIVATVTAVTGLDPHADRVIERVRALRAAGAQDLQLYHAGLATDEDLERMRLATDAFRDTAIQPSGTQKDSVQKDSTQNDSTEKETA